VFCLYFGLRVEGRVPVRGPLVLIANHASFLDSLLVGVVARRPVRFLMTDLYANVRGMRWFLRWRGVIFVREDGKHRKSMLQQAIRALRDGEVIGIFPEGEISSDGQLLELQPGAVALALRAGVDVVPIGISGAYAALPRHRWFPRPAKIRVRIGRPIPAEDLQPRAMSRPKRLEFGRARLRRALASLVG